MADRSVVVRLRAEVGQYKAALAASANQTREFGRSVEKNILAHRQSMETVGRAATGFGLVVGAGLALAAKAAVDWETAWAGVLKTVDGTETQMARLEGQLRALTSELPASHQEIAAVAEAAGQLGIEQENIVSFTRTMINLGETTNLTAEQAATSLARMANVMGTSQGDVDRMGSALVELGNNSATTEAEILEMAQRIAGAGATIGLTEADVLGFAASLSSVGIEAEAGGTAISRVFVDIAESVDEGGDKLDTFARVAGVSTEEFRRRFEDDAAGAVVAFIQGLGRVEEQGGSVFQVLEQLGLSEIRVRDALLRTSEAGDLLAESIGMSSEAWEENTALTEEAEKRYDTAAARIQVARNQLVELGIEIGSVVLPAVAGLAESVGDLAGWFSKLPQPVKTGITLLGGLAAAGSLTTGAFLLLAPRIVDTIGAVRDLRTSSGRAERAVRGLGRAARGAGLLLGGLVILQTVNSLFSEGADEIARYVEEVESLGGRGTDTKLRVLNDALKEQQRIIDDLPGTFTAGGIAVGLFSDEAAAAGRRANGLRDRINELKSEQRRARGETEELTPAQRELGETFGLTGLEAQGAADAVDQFAEELDALLESAFGAQEAQDDLQRTLRDAREQFRDNSGAVKGNTQAALDNREALRQLVEGHVDVLKKEAEAGASKEELTRKAKRHRERLIEELEQLGLNKKEIKFYTGVLDDVPGLVETLFEAQTKKAKKDATDLRKHVNRELGDIKNEPIEMIFGIKPAKTTGRGGIGELLIKAQGGRVDGPGTETSDSIPALLSNNEFVMRASAARSIGFDRLDAMNRTGQFPAFAAGGRVDAEFRADTSAARAQASALSANMNDLLSRMRHHIPGGPALAWARTQEGKPYLWGGVGPHGYDCSGWISAITNVIAGRTPHNRLFTTHSFGGDGVAGFRRGLSSPFMIGVSHAGVGHMAGTLFGTNVESAGSTGVRVGPEARGAFDRLFPNRFGYAGRGLPLEGASFDTGMGVLPARSAHIAVNATGRDEFILSEERLANAVAGAVRGRDGGAMRIAGGQMSIVEDAGGGLRAIIRDVVVEEMSDEAAFAGRR